jgi:hypothetical protein
MWLNRFFLVMNSVLPLTQENAVGLRSVGSVPSHGRRRKGDAQTQDPVKSTSLS